MTNRQFEIKLADTEELKEKAFKIREEVFVVEQRVDKREEFDEFENSSRHFVVLDPNGEPIGASRWRRTEKGIKMERFAVKESLRGAGIGQALVQATLDDIKEEAGTGNTLSVTPVILSSSIPDLWQISIAATIFCMLNAP